MGAGYLCGYTRNENNFRIDQRAAYLQNWISQLKYDKQLLIEAATEAQKAVDYIIDDFSIFLISSNLLGTKDL